MANRLVDWVALLDNWTLCLVVFGLAFGESAAGVDFLVPGEVGMVVAGAAGPRADVPLALLIVAGVVGAIGGDQVSYHLGRRYGIALVDRWAWTRRHLGPKVEDARRHFDERGGTTVFVGRWVGALRAVVPFVAGAADMPAPRFFIWNIAGAATWAATVITLGYVFGRSIADLVDRFSLWFSIAVVVALVAWGFVRYRKH
jgi:membrane-associated protein